MNVLRAVQRGVVRDQGFSLRKEISVVGFGLFGDLNIVGRGVVKTHGEIRDLCLEGTKLWNGTKDVMRLTRGWLCRSPSAARGSISVENFRGEVAKGFVGEGSILVDVIRGLLVFNCPKGPRWDNGPGRANLFVLGGVVSNVIYGLVLPRRVGRLVALQVVRVWSKVVHSGPCVPLTVFVGRARVLIFGLFSSPKFAFGVFGFVVRIALGTPRASNAYSCRRVFSSEGGILDGRGANDAVMVN